MTATPAMDRGELRSQLKDLAGLDSDAPEFLVWTGDGKQPALATTHDGTYRLVVANQVAFTPVDLEGLYGLVVVYGEPTQWDLDDVRGTHPWVAYEHARPNSQAGTVG